MGKANGKRSAEMEAGETMRKHLRLLMFPAVSVLGSSAGGGGERLRHMG
jgi:hypothetical protein